MNDDPFPGFPKELLRFLRGLQKNNTREWFTQNKATYESALKKPAAAFCASIQDELQELTGLSHEAKVFRIHRDLRFSKDKTPYNTHLHISFVPQTGATTPPLWMFGLEPGQLTVGIGVFVFDKAQLESYRKRVSGAPGAQLADALDELRAGGARISEPELKRVPKDYPSDQPRGELLRHKGLTVWADLENARVAESPELVARCRDSFERLLPVFDWLRKTS